MLSYWWLWLRLWCTGSQIVSSCGRLSGYMGACRSGAASWCTLVSVMNVWPLTVGCLTGCASASALLHTTGSAKVEGWATVPWSREGRCSRYNPTSKGMVAKVVRSNLKNHRLIQIVCIQIKTYNTSCIHIIYTNHYNLLYKSWNLNRGTSLIIK